MHEMSVRLPDPPDSLKGAPRVFYDELRQMLEAVQPAQLDAGKTSVAFDKKGLEIELVHSDRDDWGIWATVGEKDAIVGTSYAHEHFAPASQGTVEERPWTTEMVDFVAEVLRGEVEMQTTFRGSTPISVEHFNFDENGERNALGHTGFLVPARLFFWRPTRAETERVSFL
jgi:hypothetical protein